MTNALLEVSFEVLQQQHRALGEYLQVRTRVESMMRELRSLDERMEARAQVIRRRSAALAHLEATAQMSPVFDPLELPAPLARAPAPHLGAPAPLASEFVVSELPEWMQAQPAAPALPVAQATPVVAPTAPLVQQDSALPGSALPSSAVASRPTPPPAVIAPPAPVVAAPAPPTPKPIATPVATPPAPVALRSPLQPAAPSVAAGFSLSLTYRPGVLLDSGGPIGTRGECQIAACDPVQGVMVADPAAPLQGVLLMLSNAETGTEREALLLPPSVFQNEQAVAKVAALSRPELAVTGQTVVVQADDLWLTCHVLEAVSDARGVFTTLNLRVEAGEGEPQVYAIAPPTKARAPERVMTAAPAAPQTETLVETLEENTWA